MFIQKYIKLFEIYENFNNLFSTFLFQPQDVAMRSRSTSSRTSSTNTEQMDAAPEFGRGFNPPSFTEFVLHFLDYLKF